MCIRDRGEFEEALDKREGVFEQEMIELAEFIGVDGAASGPVSYTHLTLPTSDLV